MHFTRIPDSDTISMVISFNKIVIIDLAIKKLLFYQLNYKWRIYREKEKYQTVSFSVLASQFN